MTLWNDFIARMTKVGLAQNNRYSVEIQIPSGPGGGTDWFGEFDVQRGGEFERQFTLMCESTSLPGKSISTSDTNIYGPTFKMPYNQIFGEIPFVFIVDNSMIQKRFFDAWLNTIIDPNTNDANFYREYVTTVKITQLDRNLEPIYKVQLFEAYPTTINDMVLDHTSPDTIHKLSVSMAYRYWQPINV